MHGRPSDKISKCMCCCHAARHKYVPGPLETKCTCLLLWFWTLHSAAPSAEVQLPSRTKVIALQKKSEEEAELKSHGSWPERVLSSVSSSANCRQNILTCKQLIYHVTWPSRPPQSPCLLDSQALSIPCRSFAVSNLSLLSHTSLKVGHRRQCAIWEASLST